MNAKLVAIASLIVALLLGSYLWLLRPAKPDLPIPNPSLSSAVSGIHAVQTNPETGEVEYTLKAEQLIQDTSGQSQLQNVTMDWTPAQGDTYTIVASLATLDENTGDIVFFDGFTLNKPATSDSPHLQLTGERLTGNTKTKQITSDTPLHVEQGENTFRAQNMRGNLTTKDYEFGKVVAEFLPPTRTDTALF